MPGDRPGSDERWCFRCEAILPRDETQCPECGATLRPYEAASFGDGPRRSTGASPQPDGHSPRWWSEPPARLVGVGIGALAFLLGYAAIWVVASLTLTTIPITFGGLGDPVPNWKVIGWVFYRAHNAMIAGLGFSVTGVVFSGPAARSYAGTLIDSPAVFVVPPILLTLAGYAATRMSASPESYARRGASIVRGYLPLAVAGMLLTISTEHLCLFVYPEPVSSVALVGLAYPLAFGALGGVVAARTSAPAQDESR